MIILLNLLLTSSLPNTHADTWLQLLLPSPSGGHLMTISSGNTKFSALCQVHLSQEALQEVWQCTSLLFHGRAKAEHLLLQILLELPAQHLQCCCGTAGSALWILHGTSTPGQPHPCGNQYEKTRDPVLIAFVDSPTQSTEHWSSVTWDANREDRVRAIHPCVQGNLTVVLQDQIKHPRVSCCGFHSSERGQIPFFQTLPSWASFYRTELGRCQWKS